MKNQLRQALLLSSGILAAFSLPDCTTYCTAIYLCDGSIELTFDPPVQASDTVTITMTGDDVNLTGSYSTKESFGPIHVGAEKQDGGGFVVTSASVDGATPKHISYVLIADGVTVASGEVDLQYQHYTKGGEDCSEECTTAYVTVPVNQ